MGTASVINANFAFHRLVDLNAWIYVVDIEHHLSAEKMDWPAFLPHEEPDTLTILILSSFLLLLNVVGHFADRFLYCGLLGQILLDFA